MTLALLESLSLPGDPARANEDAFGHDLRAALVIDGATPLGDNLMPGPSDAAWIAQFGARRLLAHLRGGDGARKALRAALGDTQKSFEALRRAPPEEIWQTPCASMMLAFYSPSALRSSAFGAPAHADAPASAATGTSPASALTRAQGRVGGAQIEFLWFGDCAALLKQGDAPVIVIGEAFDKKARESQTAQRVAQEQNQPSTQRGHFLEMLRAIRNQINSGSYWLFSPDAKAASHVSRRLVKVQPGAALLLASDGFLALATDYGAYSADSLMAAAMARGLDVLGAELRAIEAGDPAGKKFPRFKKSDDATALLLKLS